MYKLQTNFFAGDATDFLEFDTLDKAIDYIINNKPPFEYEWDIRENGKGGSLVWTQYGGEKISTYTDDKIVVLRDLTCSLGVKR